MVRAFLTLFFTTLLAGCGGGGAFTAATGTTGTGTGTTTPAAGNATLSMRGQTVIPVGQKNTTLTFTFRNENATPITNGTLTFTVSGSARIGGKSSGSFNTDANGDVNVIVEDTASEAVLLSITPSAPNTTFTPTHLDTALYFSPVINAFVSNNGQPANGTAAAKLTVRIQDQKGYPFVGVPTALAFSPKSFATAVKVPTATDDGGLFTVDITNTVAETLMVYPALGGYVLEGLPVTFTASTLTVPASVNLTVSGSPALANGSATVDLTVIARDISGTPIADAEVVLASSSGSAVLGMARGKTGLNGVFQTTIKNTVAENVTITPTAGNVQGIPKTVVFNNPVAAGSAPPVAKVEVSLNGNPRPASGTDAAILTIFARNASGDPVVGADVSLKVSGGSAVFSPDSGKTDNLGRFVINITDKVAETFNVTPVVATVAGAIQTLTFTAIPSSSTAVPDKVTITAANNNQAADGKSPITLNIIVRDVNNIPLSGVDVTLSSDSTTAMLTAASGKTNAGGVFTTTITDTKVESFSIRANAGAKVAETNVAFGVTPPNVTISQITITDNNKAADGKEIITITALVRDAQNQPAVGAPITLAINPNTSGKASSAIPDKASGITGAGGEFIVKLTDTVAETLSVNIGVSGTANSVRSGDITFGSPPVTISQITITDNNKLSDGKEIITVTALVRNAQNQPAVGIPMTISINPNSAGKVASAIPDKASGITGAGGDFVVKFTNTVAETFSVKFTVNGTATTKDSGNLTFTEAASTVQPAALELLTSSSQLASEGKADGIILTAILKTKDNNPYKGGEVRFSSDSGTIQPVPMGTTAAGTTNESGQAQARLTTEGNQISRNITVTAKSGELTKTLVITVNGTVLSIAGPDTATLNSKQTFSLFLKDSAGKGIAGQKFKVTSSLNNPLSNATPTTDGSGVATVDLTASNAGKDTITISLLRADGSKVAEVADVTHTLSISNDNFTVASTDSTSAESDVALGVTKTFKIHWDQAGVARFNERINISATRGVLSSNSVTTNLNGEATFTIKSNNAGPTVITVAASVASGPSKILKFDFIATNAAKLDMQADPTALGVNIGTNASEQSTIIAVVRDAQNNLVKGKRIEFSVTDITGGSISPSSAVTDNFGRATIIYTAGASPSADKGVSITGTVADTPSVKATVQITVARSQTSIILGTGNKIIAPDTTKYEYPYTVLVTDVNGNPIKGAKVDLSVIPVIYSKGWWAWDENATPAGFIKTPTVSCANEDINNNGILDPGEDISKNNRLDPNNVVTLAMGASGSTSTTTQFITNDQGFADFRLVYPKEYANWTVVKLIARTTVSGTEAQANAIFKLDAMAIDFADKNAAPPGQISPFGRGVNSYDATKKFWSIDETLITSHANVNGGKTDINGNDADGVGKDTNLPPICEFATELEH